MSLLTWRCMPILASLLLGCPALAKGAADAGAAQPAPQSPVPPSVDRSRVDVQRALLMQLRRQAGDYLQRKEVMPIGQVRQYVDGLGVMARELDSVRAADVSSGVTGLHAVMRAADLDPQERREVVRTLLRSPNGRLRALAAGMGRVLDLYDAPLELRLTTLEGMPFDIADWRGKVVLVDLWSTSCGSCIAAMPDLKKIHERHHAQGFEMVAVALDHGGNRDEVLDVLAHQSVPWVNAMEPLESTPLLERFGLTSVPVYLLLDRDGKLVDTAYSGAGGRVKLEHDVQRLLGPSAADVRKRGGWAPEEPPA